MARNLALATAMTLLLLLSACSGGSDSQPGAKDPAAAVRQLLEAIAKQDDDAMAKLIDPAYDADEVGLGDLVRLTELAEKVQLKDVKLETELEPSKEHARVFVTTTVVTEEGEADLENEALLTSLIDGRWYVTSPNSDYWRAQLRPSPADWQLIQADANPALPGVYVPPHPGADAILLRGSTDDRAHLGNETTVPICTAEQIASNSISSPLCYPSNPPTSGPHASSAAPVRVFTLPVAKEFLVHTMEHGAVVIWYNSNDPAVIQKLTALTDIAISRGQLVALVPYPGMEANTIALTAWTRLDKFPASQLDTGRIQRFIAAHERRFNPEGF